MNNRTSQSIDNRSVLPRRNYGALLLAALNPGVVGVAPGSLTLTGFPPTILQSNTPAATVLGKYSQIDATRIQPRRNIAAQYLAIAQQGTSISVPIVPGALQLTGFAPTVTQSTQIFVGQDTQRDVWPDELFQTPKKGWHWYVLQGQGVNINIDPGSLTLTGFAPTVTQTGTIQTPLGSLALTGFAPVITQTTLNNVQVQLGGLSLQGFAPVISQSGALAVPFGQMFLTGFPPIITVAPVPVYSTDSRYTIQRVTYRAFTVSTSTGPRFEAKAPSEQVLLTFDFSPDLATGEVLIGAPSVAIAVTASGTDPNPSAIANGIAGFDTTDTKTVVPVQGGLDGNDYVLTVTANTSTTGKVLTLTGILPVRVGTGI